MPYIFVSDTNVIFVYLHAFLVPLLDSIHHRLLAPTLRTIELPCVYRVCLQRYGCECPENRCGSSCDECCPLFHQQPPPTGGSADAAAVCEQCNCFGHADSCAYNQTVADQRLSLNLRGDYSGGGACLQCRHNTAGINCQRCADGYFRSPGMDPRDPQSCLPCACDGIGSTGSCVSDDSRIKDGLVSDVQCSWLS